MNTYNCSAMWDTRNFNNIHLRAADEKEVKAEGERDGTERGKVAYLFSLVPQHPSNPVAQQKSIPDLNKLAILLLLRITSLSRRTQFLNLLIC